MSEVNTNRKTQQAAILLVLLAARGEWVSLFEILATGAAQYSARIHELRKAGHRIENRTERHDAKAFSYFRIPLGVQSQEKLFSAPMVYADAEETRGRR
jgi:hypothetical protein